MSQRLTDAYRRGWYYSLILQCARGKEEGFSVILSSVDIEGSCWHPTSNCIPSFHPSFNMEVDKQCMQCSTLHSTPQQGSELKEKVKRRVEIFFYARNLFSYFPSNNSNKGELLISLHNLDNPLVGLINSYSIWPGWTGTHVHTLVPTPSWITPLFSYLGLRDLELDLG